MFNKTAENIYNFLNGKVLTDFIKEGGEVFFKIRNVQWRRGLRAKAQFWSKANNHGLKAVVIGKRIILALVVE